MDGTLARRFGAVLGAAALVLSACGGGASPTGGTTTTTATTSETTTETTTETTGSEMAPVDVALQEWAIVPAPDSTTAGEVTFNVANTGPDFVHEFVIIKTDLSAADLPTGADGSVSEAGAGMEVIDEIEDLAVGSSEELTVTLEAGKYVLICNIVDAAQGGSHYTQGMRIDFTVN